jgi:hypothetical protein
MEWKTVLENSADGSHIAQLYQSDLFLCQSVSVYIRAGLKRGEAVVIVSTPNHTDAFCRGLSADGFDVKALEKSGQMVLLDADATLSSISINGEPDREQFIKVVGGILEKAGDHYPRVRAFGEMVNLLWEKGELSRAIALEELWNDLAKTHAFSLFCAYVMDNFNPMVHDGPLQKVCKTHSYLIPAADYELLESSVSDAIEDVLGPTQASMLLSLASSQKTKEDRIAKMPPAQRALLWLRENMPLTADKVLLRSRSHYDRSLAELNFETT